MSASTLASPSWSVETCASRSSEFICSPLPEWIWSSVEHLYKSIFSSRVMLEKPELLQSLPYAWVERNEYQITDILLFRIEGCTVRVANEVITLSSDVIERFSNDIFITYPNIQFVRLHAIKLQSTLKNSLAFKSIFSEDYVLNLPSSKEGWLACLSSRTREKQRLYVKKFSSEKNAIRFCVIRTTEIDESIVRHILKLSYERINKKGKYFGISSEEENQLCKQMKKVGCLYLLKKNDEICAGLLCSVIDTDIYIHVLAHDQKFNALRLGLVCCILTIEHAISNEYQRLHFLWGHYDYKKKMGAKPVELNRLLILKNVRKGLLHPLILGRWYWDCWRDMSRKYWHKYVLRN